MTRIPEVAFCKISKARNSDHLLPPPTHDSLVHVHPINKTKALNQISSRSLSTPWWTKPSVSPSFSCQYHVAPPLKSLSVTWVWSKLESLGKDWDQKTSINQFFALLLRKLSSSWIQMTPILMRSMINSKCQLTPSSLIWKDSGQSKYGSQIVTTIFKTNINKIHKEIRTKIEMIICRLIRKV